MSAPAGTPACAHPTAGSKLSLPKLGFLGVGWIGRNRMEAIAASGAAEVSAIVDASDGSVSEAMRVAPGAVRAHSLEELLGMELDGVVIATPSAMHAEQSIRSLEAGLAVFCQKPLARTGNETRKVVDSARGNNRLLGVDLSYRFIQPALEVHALCMQGELGEIYAADLVFHNAYGPDKQWFYDRALSGGGCVIDLGIHLVDMALWNLRFPKTTAATSRILAQGRPLVPSSSAVEDYCEARIDLENGATVRLACSWKLPAGREAVISATFYGSKGGASFYNIDGSFYDFAADRFTGTQRRTLSTVRGGWGGAAAVHWARQLAISEHYRSDIEDIVTIGCVLDAIYAGAQA